MFNNTLVTSPLFTSLELAAPMNRNILALKVAIDNAILNFLLQKEGKPKIDIELEV